ncbi:hypothetical protein CRUP_029518 [Coryphaenoides rupestris]|nr:hypothetical protein CRUP_029518 [Coryphaenoides rupestris]
MADRRRRRTRDGESAPDKRRVVRRWRLLAGLLSQLTSTMFGETIKDLCIDVNAPEGQVSYSSGERLEGEAVRILCEFSNGSSRVAKCKVVLVQKQVFSTLRGTNKTIPLPLASQTGDPVGPHSGDVHCEFTLDLPGDLLFSISNCQILELSYVIEHRRSHSAKVVYFNSKTMILENEQAAISSKLPPGTHVYPFTCHLPQGDFPSSFKGKHGEIMYMLIVGLDRPWHLTKEHSTKINFASRPYPNYELMTPLSRSNDMTLCCLCCASGPISMNSSRVAKCKAVLVQKQVFSTLSGTSNRTIALPLASQTGDPVGPHSGDVHCEFTLDLPGDLKFSISNCQILELSYVIEVRLSVKCALDLTVPCPIFICNPPQYNGAPVGVC